MALSSLGKAEDGISVTLVLLVFLIGWIKAFYQTSQIRVKDVKDGDYAYAQMILLSAKLVGPYLEVWILLLTGIIILFIIDKIFVTIMSLTAGGNVTIGDGYGTAVFLSALKQLPILGAMITSMAASITLALAWMFYIRIQLDPQEELLSRGLKIIQIFGLVLAFNMMVIQGYFLK